MFEGHQFIKVLNDNWVFDLTEYIGYRVKLNDDREVVEYKVAFQALALDDEIMYNKAIRVPLKVLKETSNIIRNYQEEMGVD